MESRDVLCDMTIDAELAGKLVRDVLRTHLQMSRKIIRKLVEAQGVIVNGENVWLTWRLAEGDTLRLLLPTEESVDILPESIPFHSVYEDDEVLVVDKQAGLIVHPTHGHWTGTLANGIVYDWKQRGVAARFRPVHRIDQWTSGLLVIAKNHYALKLLAGQMMERTIERSYVAIVHGRVELESGLIDQPIGRDDDDFRVRVVRADESKEARTEYRVLERFGVCGTLVELKLQTGRTHQIRVHMKWLGHPLFGDAMYGPPGDEVWIERQALHAKVLGFHHPTTGEWLRFEAPLPEDMARLVDRLRAATGAPDNSFTE